jgi:hypothetical protein
MMLSIRNRTRLVDLTTTIFYEEGFDEENPLLSVTSPADRRHGETKWEDEIYLTICNTYQLHDAEGERKKIRTPQNPSRNSNGQS